MEIIKPSATILAMTGHKELPYSYEEKPELLIEACGRTCYKSEDKITEDSATKFVEMIKKRRHGTVLEHSWEVREYGKEDLGRIGNWNKYLWISDIYKCLIGGNFRAWREAEEINSLLRLDYITVSEEDVRLGAIEDNEPFLMAATVRIICDRGVSHEMVRHRPPGISQESTRYVSSIKTEKQKVLLEQDIIDLYNTGFSMRKISEMSDEKFTEWQVYKILKRNDIKSRPKGNTGIIYNNFFNRIDTVEKAYLIGLIQSDGSVSNKSYGPTVSITQHRNYMWYIHRMITNFIRSEAKPWEDGTCQQIGFTSPEIHHDLISKGIVPNKSYDQTNEDIEKLWASIPAELIPSFLRGLLDGDGHIKFFKQKNKGETDSCCINWTGHGLLLEKISDWIAKNFGKTKASVKKDKHSEHLYRFTISNPSIGDKIVREMIKGFQWPYGHPVKTSRMIERVGGDYQIAKYGDSQFVVVQPLWIDDDPFCKFLWLKSMDESERSYSMLRSFGWPPEKARSVLTNSLKTELCITTTLYNWQHIFRMRAIGLAGKPHPQMVEIMEPLLEEFKKLEPTFFSNII